MIRRTVENLEISADLKSSVALAAAAFLTRGHGNEGDRELLEFAADRFWDGVDVARGVVPGEDTLRGYVYRKVFHYPHGAGGEVVSFPGILDRLSRQLLERIQQIPSWEESSSDRVRALLYAYVTSTPRGTESPFITFLRPKEGTELVKMALRWATTPDRRRDLGRELNSLSGHAILRNMEGAPGEKRRLAEEVIRFYESHYRDDWYPAKMMEAIYYDLPDFKQRIAAHETEWGLGP